MEQAEFYPKSDTSQPCKEIDAVAETIAAHAPRNPYAAQELRDAAIVQLRDEDLRAQQTGYRDKLDTASLPPRHEQSIRRRFELPGRSTGRSNAPQPPTRTELLNGTTHAEREELHARNKRGAAVARAALRKAQRD